MGRLFWKIFAWFWLAMVIMVVGVGFGVAPFPHDDHFPKKPDRNEIKEFFLTHGQAMVAAVLRREGLETARAKARELDQNGPVWLTIVEIDANQPPESSPARPFRAHRVTLKDGRRFEIHAKPKAIIKWMHFLSHRLGIPLPLLARSPERFFAKLGLAVLISGLVCFWLAWTITRPLTRLGEATRLIAAGDLSARVAGGSPRWRDEITALSQDFNRMAERLQALMTAQQRLLHDVSHELRSPLARLQVAVALTRRDSDERVGRLLDRVERESGRLDRLVGQLLTLSRLEAGHEYPLDETVDLADLLAEIVQDANFEAQDSGRRVHLQVQDAPCIRGNRELLRRALENVIRNGVKYTAPETEARVVLTRADPGHARVEVLDQGPGLPPGTHDQIFEPFVRLEENAGERKAGYGLGLAIARRVVLAHGGDIKAENRPQGGLCVHLQLPA